MLENAPCRDGIPHIADGLDFQCLPLPAQLLQISRLHLRDRVLLLLFLGLLDKQLFQLGVRLGFALPGLFLVFLPLFFLVLGSAAGTRRPFLCRLFRDNCRRVGGRFRRAGGRMIQVALYSCLSCLEDAFLFCLAFESSCIGTHGKASRSLSRAGVSHRAVWIFAYILLNYYALSSKGEAPDRTENRRWMRSRPRRTRACPRPAAPGFLSGPSEFSVVRAGFRQGEKRSRGRPSTENRFGPCSLSVKASEGKSSFFLFVQRPCFGGLLNWKGGRC